MVFKIEYQLNKQGIEISSNPKLSLKALLHMAKKNIDIIYSPEQIAALIDEVNLKNQEFNDLMLGFTHKEEVMPVWGYEIQFVDNQLDQTDAIKTPAIYRQEHIKSHFQNYGALSNPVQYLNEDKLINYQNQVASHASAHATFINVSYPTDVWPIHVIYKKNKHGDPHASEIEAAISEVATLFLPPNLTSRASIVKNQEQISGIAIEDIGYAISRREPNTKEFLNLNGDTVTATCPENIPYYFLNSKEILDNPAFGSSFFSYLMEKQKKGEIRIDMASLAAILGCSYVMQEDDLHKGNIGFYCTKVDNIPNYHFFKIDHDLMLVEDYMSYIDPRANNILLKDKDFAIKTNDLDTFPVISTGHHYWPTKSVLMRQLNRGITRAAAKFTPSTISNMVKDSRKTYTAEDITAFSALNQNEAFRKHQWQNLLKQILIPREFVDLALMKQLGADHPDRAELLSIIQSRQNELEDALYFNKDFGDYFNKHYREAFKTIQNELQIYLNSAYPDSMNERKNKLIEILNSRIENFKTEMELKEQYEPNAKNPLHTTIARGHYRFGETPRQHQAFLNITDDIDESPLRLALKKYLDTKALKLDAHLQDKPVNDIKNPGSDYIMVFRDLMRCGATVTPKLEMSLIENAINLNETKFVDDFFKTINIDKINNYQGLKSAMEYLADSNPDHNIPRALKKQMAYELIKRVRHQISHADLISFQTDLLNDVPYCLFIRKFTNQYWYSRILRKNPYGNTNTSNRITQLIQKTLKEPEIFGLDELFKKDIGELIGTHYRLGKPNDANGVINLNKMTTIGADFSLDICVEPSELNRAWSIAGPILLEYQPNNISISKKGVISIIIPPGKEERYQQMIEAVEVALHIENIPRNKRIHKHRLGIYTHMNPLNPQLKTIETPFNYMLAEELAQDMHREILELIPTNIPRNKTVEFTQKTQSLFYHSIMAFRNGDITTEQLIKISKSHLEITKNLESAKTLNLTQNYIDTFTKKMNYGIPKQLSYRLHYILGLAFKHCGEKLGSKALEDKGLALCQKFDVSQINKRMSKITEAIMFFSPKNPNADTNDPTPPPAPG